MFRYEFNSILLLFNLTSNFYIRIAISTFAGTIFVARSPASVIAVINELRAKGPFTRMALGVTVLTDFLLVILFALVISLVNALLTEEGFSFYTILIIFSELVVSFGISYLLYLFFKWILSLKLNTSIKAIIILGGGWSIHFIALGLNMFTENYLKLHFYIEPLLVVSLQVYCSLIYLHFEGNSKKLFMIPFQLYMLLFLP